MRSPGWGREVERSAKQTGLVCCLCSFAWSICDCARPSLYFLCFSSPTTHRPSLMTAAVGIARLCVSDADEPAEEGAKVL